MSAMHAITIAECRKTLLLCGHPPRGTGGAGLSCAKTACLDVNDGLNIMGATLNSPN